MAAPSIGIVSPSFTDIRDVFRGAKDVFVCTPYFSRDGLAELEGAIRKAKRAEFWIALNVTHWMSGYSDFDAFEATLRRMQDTFDDIRLSVRSSLHAKLYYSPDSRKAILGSSNLTSSGFGGNIEVGAVVAGKTCDQIDEWIDTQRRRVQSIAIEDFIACVQLSSDAVKSAANAMQDSSPPALDDYNAAVDLFERELVRKLTPSSIIPKAKLKKTTLEPGKRITPGGGDIEKSLPKKWPPYAAFLDFLKSKSKNDDADVLLRRANGESNLQGHVKHFYWASLMFFLENPALIKQVKAKEILGKTVRWEDVKWVGAWRAFLERHDDESYPDIGVSFHTIKVYLPPTLGGTTISGGGGVGNFKRAIVFVADLLRERIS